MAQQTGLLDNHQTSYLTATFPKHEEQRYESQQKLFVVASNL